MAQRARNLARRDFLKSGLAAAIGSAATGTGRGVSAGGQARPHQIATRPFGKTNRELPILGMGSSPMVARWAVGYGATPRSIEERAPLVRHAYDQGARYFDTARGYYDTERVMGQGLKGVRADCFVATKVATADPALVRPSVEKSLEELGMDRVDLVQVHSPAIEKLGFEGAMKIQIVPGGAEPAS